VPPAFSPFVCFSLSFLLLLSSTLLSISVSSRVHQKHARFIDFVIYTRSSTRYHVEMAFLEKVHFMMLLLAMVLVSMGFAQSKFPG
jgi:hypothetical protein